MPGYTRRNYPNCAKSKSNYNKSKDSTPACKLGRNEGKKGKVFAQTAKKKTQKKNERPPMGFAQLTRIEENEDHEISHKFHHYCERRYH